jgi:hypothetical protein
MNLLIRSVLLLGVCCGAATAQRSHFHWLADAGGLTADGITSFRAGLSGGGEIAIGRGFSAGPELGFIAPRTGRFRDTVVGLGSANGYYHFRGDRTVRFDPYASMGYSALFRREHVNLFNYGGGLTYWVRPDVGFRAEFRDRAGSGMHLWSFRVGVSFTRLFP